MTFKVLIIGGGPAGLALANSLKHQGISFKLFERDGGPDFRKQGWTFGFNRGIEHLRQYIPDYRFKNFEKQVSTDPYETKGYATLRILHNNQQVLSVGGPGFESYRLNRQRFRRWLLEDIEEEVAWNKQAKSFFEHENGVRVQFEDGSSEEGDFLVAADGAMSKLAQQLLGEAPSLSPLQCYGFTQWVSKQELSEISQMTTQATMVVGESTCLFYCVNNMDPDQPKPYEVFFMLSQHGTHDTEELSYVERVQSWASTLPSTYRDWILNIPKNTDIMKINVHERSPVFNRLITPKHRVVLAGDAVHPMTMFRGNGANQATIDANVLAGEIIQVVSGKKSLEQAVTSYYEELVPRTQTAVKESHEAAELIHLQPEKFYESLNNIPTLVKK